MSNNAPLPLPPPSTRAEELRRTMQDFMRDEVLPAEATYARQRAAGDLHDPPAVLEDLKARAKVLGLWNSFLPAESGLTQLEYAPIAELAGWSLELGPEAINGAAPDTGNMELFHLVGTPEQQKEWLEPLLDGRNRSAFAMTEPEVASSDATNIRTIMVRDGDTYVINGRKCWRAARWTHGAGSSSSWGAPTPTRRPTGSSR